MVTEEKRNDEIDLIELFQKMGNGIKRMFLALLNFLYQVLLFFIRKAIFIGIITVIFLSLGIIFYKISPRYYSSTMEAYSNAMSSIDMINYVNNINELFLDKNTEEIQVKLGLSANEVEKIKTIKAFKTIDYNEDGVPDLTDFNEKYKTSDTIVSPSRFVIKAEILAPEIIPLIQAKIIDYINNNKYITELNTVRKQQLNELISKYDTEILILDSLKKTEYFASEEKVKTQAGQLLVLNEKETQLYHEKIITMYKQKQEIERTLKLRLEPVTVIQGFSDLSKIENKITSYLIKFGLIGIAFGIFLAFVREKFDVIKKVIEDSKTQ